MGVQRIQETSTASYGKSVEAAAAGNSSAAGSGSATGGTTQTVENITTPCIHDATNRVMIKIVDKDTKEVLKEYPPEKTLDMIAKVWEVAGLLVDEKM